MNAPLVALETPGFAPGLNDAMRSIVVVGGGFGGCAAARRLSKRLPEGYRLELVSDESYTTFHPLLAEVVGATINWTWAMLFLADITHFRFTRSRTDT